MNDDFVPEYAILGHPNEGKSAVVSTLAEDDSVKVSPTPGETLQCRTFPVKIDGREIIRFTDTPGFQLPGQTLKWMESYSGKSEDIIRAFISAHKDTADFKNECELFTPVERGAGIIFVVDGSRPIRNNDRKELEILRLTGCPRMAIINCKDPNEAYLEAWKDAFRKSFNSVRVFNAHNANYGERIALLESLKFIDQDWQPALETVISAFKKDWNNRNLRVAEIICDLLDASLNHSVARTYPTETEGKAATSELQAVYQKEIMALEKKSFDLIRRLFKHHIFQVDLPQPSVINESLFAKRTWQVLGLTQHQLAGIAAISGGVIGAGLDIAAHGLSFGVFTAIGSAMGAGSIYFFGEQMAKASIVGLNIGGYRVTIGPNENVNFPYIILDRALLYYSHVMNWAHGRRDYPDSNRIMANNTNEKLGFTTTWSLKEKKICRSFFQALQKKDEIQKEAIRKSMVDLFLKTMEEISENRK